ncbi:MAG: adenylate kinase [Erysipelotrichaceae bacterium]|nr:adenylate kinase [Erysipelotrichaceae bacterium]MBR5049086.1 adenylate kinase [Erysipelotrichaceae bacterium]
MRMLIMGPAGAGKGTVSERICADYKVPHISTGDMFREELRNNTPLGQQAQAYMSQGLLVPDEVTIAMVKSRLSRQDCADGYLLDGFPRSLPQAIAISDLDIDAVINLKIDEQLLVDRIVERRICRNCGAIYNRVSLPSKVEGVCDNCGGELYQRGDDTYEALRVRLDSYHNETQAAVDYFRDMGIVYDVNAGQGKEEVYRDVQAALAKVKGEE